LEKIHQSHVKHRGTSTAVLKGRELVCNDRLTGRGGGNWFWGGEGYCRERGINSKPGSWPTGIKYDENLTLENEFLHGRDQQKKTPNGTALGGGGLTFWFFKERRPKKMCKPVSKKKWVKIMGRHRVSRGYNRV